MRPIRQGFTLIEMLVAMGLTMFIMVILSQAFVAGLDTFRGLKAIGDMQANLRVALLNLQSDLRAPHFEGTRRLSDSSLVTKPPLEGYFMIRQGNFGAPPAVSPFWSTNEGSDADNVISLRSDNQVIAGTIRLNGNRREHFMMSRDIPAFPPPANPGNPQIWSPLSKPIALWGQIIDASNVSPIVITTSQPHNLTTSDRVLIVGVAGNTNANGLWTITAATSTAAPYTITLGTNLVTGAASAGNGVYTGNGCWTASYYDRDALFNPGGPPLWTTSAGTLPLVSSGLINPNPPPPMLPDTYSSQWAEFAYFLVQTGTTEDATNPAGGGTPLYGLYRAQYLLVPDAVPLAAANSSTNPNKQDSRKLKLSTEMETYQATLNTLLTTTPYYYTGISCQPRINPPDNQLEFNSPAMVADQNPTAWGTPATQVVRTTGMENRVLPFGFAGVSLPLTAPAFPAGTPPGRPPRNSTLVAANVLSFNVQVLYPAGPFQDVQPVALPTVAPNPTPYIGIYDTTLGPHLPAGFNTIRALKITLRVFDANSGFTRQMSLVQDM